MAANVEPQGVLPMHVQQAAIAQQLGPFTKVYKPNGGRWGILVVTMVVLAIILFATIIQAEQNGDFVDYVGYTNDPVLGLMTSLAIGLFILAVAGWGIFKLVPIIGLRTYLFQQGLIIERKGQIQIFPWSQIEVRRNITSRSFFNLIRGSGFYVPSYGGSFTFYKYTLRRVDGYQIKLDNDTAAGIYELGEAIIAGVSGK